MEPKEFEKRMKAAAGEIAFAPDLLSDIGLTVEGNAKKRTPVATGNLRRSITNRVEGNAVYIGTAVEYGVYVHEGTKYMAPRPFLEEGIEDSRSFIDRLVGEYGGKVLEKVAGK